MNVYTKVIVRGKGSSSQKFFAKVYLFKTAWYELLCPTLKDKIESPDDIPDEITLYADFDLMYTDCANWLDFDMAVKESRLKIAKLEADNERLSKEAAVSEMKDKIIEKQRELIDALTEQLKESGNYISLPKPSEHVPQPECCCSCSDSYFNRPESDDHIGVCDDIIERIYDERDGKRE